MKKFYPERRSQTKDSRDLPVKDLTKEQCKGLLVHAHECTVDRRRCYILKAYPMSDGVRYFDDEENARLEALIKSGI